MCMDMCIFSHVHAHIQSIQQVIVKTYAIYSEGYENAMFHKTSQASMHLNDNHTLFILHGKCIKALN